MGGGQDGGERGVLVWTHMGSLREGWQVGSLASVKIRIGTLKREHEPQKSTTVRTNYSDRENGGPSKGERGSDRVR